MKDKKEIQKQQRERLMDNRTYPFFVGDIIDIFHRSNTKNMAMVQGFIDGDKTIIREVNRRTLQSVVVLVLLLLLITLAIWLLISFGSYLYQSVTSCISAN